MRRILLAPVMVASVAALACGGSSTGPHARSWDVQIMNDGFHPETVTIAQNDTVRWTSVDGVHTVTFTGALPPGADPTSGPIAIGQSVFTVFLKDSTFTYQDDSTQNTGVVIVK